MSIEGGIEGTVGGSVDGPTRDADGIAIAAGDQVEVVHMDDPQLSRFVGHVAEVEWVQDTFPFSQVFLVFQDESGLEPLSSFSAWVRKVG